jgi:hypothetical protein
MGTDESRAQVRSYTWGKKGWLAAVPGIRSRKQEVIRFTQIRTEARIVMRSENYLLEFNHFF